MPVYWRYICLDARLERFTQSLKTQREKPPPRNEQYCILSVIQYSRSCYLKRLVQTIAAGRDGWGDRRTVFDKVILSDGPARMNHRVTEFHCIMPVANISPV